MPNYEGKVAKVDAIQQLWNISKQTFIKKDGNKVLTDNNYSDNDRSKLNGIEENANNYELPIASAEIIGGIRLGAGLEIDNRGVVNTITNNNVNVGWNNVVSTPTTLAGYGITDAASKSEVLALQNKLTGVYHFAGSKATVEELDEIESPEHGDVYNVEADGQNYAWNADTQEWDSLGAIIDLSNYLTEDDIQGLTATDIDLITGAATSAAGLKAVIANSNEVELCNDVALGEALVIDHDFTLDLNGRTLSSNLNDCLISADGATITIKGNGEITNNGYLVQAINGGKVIVENGTFNSNNVGFGAVGEDSEIIFNDGELNAIEGGIGAFDGGAIEMNGGTMNIGDNFGLFTNGTEGRGGNTIVMNGGSIVGNIRSAGYEAIGVYIANNDTFIMNDGEIIGNGGAGICQRAGSVTINGGTITGQASVNRPEGSTGGIGDKKKNMSQSAYIYDQESNYPGQREEGMSLTITGGTFNGVAHSLEVLSNEENPNITITGGTFNPAYPEA